jgi:hypothetical protein
MKGCIMVLNLRCICDVFLTIFLIAPIINAATDVTAPAQSQKYTITVENIGAVDMESVSGAATVSQNPDNLISITGVTPSNVKIPAGGSKDFEIEFDVACPSATAVARTETAKFEFSIASTPNGPYYAPALSPKVYDGSPGPVWEADFTLEIGEIFTAICTPPSQTINDGQTKPHDIVVTNQHPTEDLKFKADVAGGGAGWSVSPTSFSERTVGPGDSTTFTFNVSNSGAASDLSLSLKVTETTCGIDKLPEVDGQPGSPGHVTDHPDDNFSVASSEYPTNWLYDSKSPIGVLSSGWGEGLHYLLGKFNVATTVVRQDLTILNEPGKDINDLDVLLIGSAGLAGLESSPTFRKKLSDFVEQGGSLIAFTAKNGYEFKALPGGEVSGYGWDEDQSCLSNAVSIIEYHQMLSGQTSTNITANFDGYFTKWPDNASVLMQRNKNGMPAMVTYPFGEGHVTAMTCFPDWSYGHNQSKDSDQKMVRDAVAWSLQAKTLPEFSIGADVSFNFDIINQSGAAASQLKLTVRDPNRNVVKEETVAFAISHDDTLPYSFYYSEGPTDIGIWYVEYALLDGDGDEIQAVTLGEQFVISNPTEVAAVKDITFSVNSDAENYANGSEGVFNIHVWNHTDALKNVTVWWSFPHNYWAKHDPIYGSPGTTRPGNVSNLKETLEVPANGEAVHTYTVPVYSYDRLWADFYDEGGGYLGNASRAFYSYDPSCIISASTANQEYKGGDEVSLTINLKNKQSSAYTTSVNVTVLDPENAKVWENAFDVALESYGSSTKDVTFTMPATPVSGAYRIRVEATTNGNKAGSDYVHFIVPEAFLALTPVVPGVIVAGDNNVKFDIENYGLAGITEGTLDVSLVGPDESVLWTETGTFNLDVNGIAEADFIMPVTSIVFGNYKLVYQAHTAGISTKSAQKVLPSSCLVTVTQSKASWRVREQLEVEIGITNNGRFALPDISAAVAVPGVDGVSESFSLLPGQNSILPLSVVIPETMTFGNHTGTVTLSLPSGNTFNKTFAVIIQKPVLKLAMEEAVFSAGDVADIEIENIGGTDAVVDYEIAIMDNKGVSVQNLENSLNLMAGGKSTFACAIPEAVVNGNYNVEVLAVVQSTNDTTTYMKSIDITGLIASLDIQTDKQVYSEAEVKNAVAEIALSQGSISDGNLNLKVTHVQDNTKTWTTQADWETGELYQVDITTYPGDVVVDPASVTGGIGQVGQGEHIFCIIKDNDAWGIKANETVIQETGYGYDVVSTSMLPSWDFAAAGNRIVIIESDQAIQTYINIYNNKSRIDDFVANGGILLAHSSDEGWTGNGDTPSPYDQFRPGPERRIYKYGMDYLEISDPTHPFLKGITDAMLDNWNHAAYCYFADLMEGTHVIVEDDGLPICIEYQFGLGTVFATMQILEWPFRNYSGTQQLLRNEIAYAISLLKNSGISLKLDADRSVTWNTIDWTSDEPENTDVLVTVRTAATEEELSSAGWSKSYSTPGAPLNLSAGRWAEVKAILVTPDPSTITPVLHDLSISYTENTDVWEKDVALSVNESSSLTEEITPLSGTGKFRLEGTATSSLNQQVDMDEYSFYVGDDPIILTFNTDKKVYKPGQLVTVTGTVYNNSNENMAGLAYELTRNGQSEFNETIDLSANSERPFSFSFSAPDAMFVLAGTIEGRTIVEHIDVGKPSLDIYVDAPEVVGRALFDVSVRLSNTSNVDAEINLSIHGSSQDVIIPARQVKVVTSQLTLTENTTIIITASGDVSETIQKEIQFGEAAVVTVLPGAAYPEGTVNIPYNVENVGSFDTEFDITFTVGANTVTKEVFVPTGETIEGDLSFELLEGDYSIVYNSYFTSGAVDFRVAKADKIDLQLQVAQSKDISVLILQDAATENAFNTILTEAGITATIAPVYEYQWDGTNPSPDDFDVIILPAGNTYSSEMPVTGQQALVSFVENGGGLILTEFITYSRSYYNYYSSMDDLLLYEPGQWNYNSGNETVTIIGEHPITAGLPETFSGSSLAGNNGGLKAGVTALASGSVLPNLLAVKQFGQGRIAQYAIAGHYSGTPFLSSEYLRTLFVNSVNWVGKSTEDNNVRAHLVVSNEGFNSFDGQVTSATQFFAKTEDLVLAAGQSETFDYEMDISEVEPGTYTFTSKALYGGRILQQAADEFEIGGPIFELATIPENLIFTPGQEVTMSFGVKNTGMAEGEADVSLVVADIVDDKRTSWIAPGIEKEESWTFQLPDDYTEGEYKAEFTLNGELTEIPFAVNGVKLAVEASLDKPVYELGETAVLTLEITNESTLFPGVYATAASNGDNDRVDFTLSDQNTIQLELPISESTLSRIAYGIYLSSGRALYLNTIFVRIIKGAVTLYTDENVYNAGDEVTVNVATAEAGDLAVTTSTGFENTFSISGDYSFTFTLPVELTSGTQTINYTLGEYSGSCYFDVMGYALKVSEMTLDKQTYDPVDEMSINFDIESNADIQSVIKGWLYDPSGTYTEMFEVTRDLVSGDNKVSVNTNISTTVDGVHKVVYGIYKAGVTLTLVTGAEAFDVRQAALISVAPVKETFSEDELVNISVSAFACREYGGKIDLISGGNVIAGENVNLNGQNDITISAGMLPSGDYPITARLHKDGAVMSEKTTSFTVLDMNAPASPVGLSLAMDGSIVDLTWTPNSEPDLDGYNIYKNGVKDNAVPVRVSRYREEGVISGEEYTFYVTAIDRTGNESGPSANAVVKVDNKAPVITMDPVSSVVSGVPVTLTYSVTDDTDENPLVTAEYTSPTTFTMDGVYDIMITAEDASGNKAVKSITITIESGAPDPIAVLVAEDAGSDGVVDLSWMDYDAPADIAGYYIYINSVDFTSVSGLTTHTTVNGDVKTFQVTGLTNGEQYYFAVVPFDAHDNINPDVVAASAVPTGGTGILQITSVPEGANVFLGGNYGYPGEYKGAAPLTIADLNQGDYIVQVRYPGYSKYYTMATVVTGTSVDVDVAMTEKTIVGLNEGEILQLAGENLNTGGYSAPFIVDWDMDGKKDLISPNSSGTISLYLNSGTDAEPLFTEETVVIDQLSCISAFPVDWNNDLKKDMVVGNQSGELYVLLNTGTDKQPDFSSPKRIGTITVGGSAIPSICDWNSDGKKDLVIGASNGDITLYLNTGTDQEPQFQNEADGTLLTLNGGEAAPFVTYDWNTDGLQDLVVGDVTGNITVYLNSGTAENPVIEQNGTVIKALAVDGYSRPFILDYDNDTKDDLVVGGVNGEIKVFKGAQILSAPTGVTASAKSGKVGVEWEAVDNAVSYTVYREDLGDTPLGTTQYCAYVDYNVVNGTTYIYTIAAVDENGNVGSKSAEVSATPVARSRTR